ncbi:MAG: PadR family transcriptional regulator [Chitinophagales bacterium]
MGPTNKSKYMILAILNESPGSSGYDIKKHCDNLSYFWNENYSRIYPVLKQMEEEGLVTQTEEKGKGRPPKNVYFITPKGKEEYIKWLMLPVEPSSLRSELLLKLFFSSDIPVNNMIQKLQAELAEQMKIRDSLDNQVRQLKAQEWDNRKLPVWLSIMNYRKIMSEAETRWCGETIKLLQNDNPYTPV